MNNTPNDDRRKLRQYSQLAALALIQGIACLLLTACLDKKTMCGDDMTAVEVPGFGDTKTQTYCTPKIVDTGEDTSAGEDSDDTPSDVSDASVDDGGNDTGLPSGMDDPCDGEGSCTGEADYCNQPPGYPGMCTVSDCTLSPDNCPTGYYCFDLSIFESSLPTICVAETR
jgi:hypothetical protein